MRGKTNFIFAKHPQNTHFHNMFAHIGLAQVGSSLAPGFYRFRLTEPQKILGRNSVVGALHIALATLPRVFLLRAV